MQRQRVKWGPKGQHPYLLQHARRAQGGGGLCLHPQEVQQEGASNGGAWWGAQGGGGRVLWQPPRFFESPRRDGPQGKAVRVGELFGRPFSEGEGEGDSSASSSDEGDEGGGDAPVARGSGGFLRWVARLNVSQTAHAHGSGWEEFPRQRGRAGSALCPDGRGLSWREVEDAEDDDEWLSGEEPEETSWYLFDHRNEKCWL